MSITLPVTTRSPLPPPYPAAGDYWINSATDVRYVWYVMDNGQSQWVQTDVPTGGDGLQHSPVRPGAIPPGNPRPGDFWTNPVTGVEYVYYVMDNDQGQWVQSNVPMSDPSGSWYPGRLDPIGPSPTITNPTPKITLAPLPPGTPNQGDLWWSTVTGQQSVWYFDGNTYQWVISNYGGAQGPPGLPGPIGQIVADVGLTGGGSTPVVTIGIDDTVVALKSETALLAPLDSPVFTGTPTAPTPTGASPPLQLATLGWTNAQIAAAIATVPPIPPSLPPSGPAGGMLTGNYPDPQISALGSPVGYLLTVAPGPIAAWAPPPSTTPSGAAGGDLAGTYPNPQIKPATTNGYVMTTVAGAVGWLPLPAPPTTLPPSGPAGGQLAGTYPNPNINAAGVTAGWVLTAAPGGVAGWAALPAPPTTLPPSGAAGGDLAGSYPNPTIKASVALTGNPTVPLASGSPSGNIASTLYVANQLSGFANALPGLIPPGTNGQVLTTVGTTTQWAAGASAVWIGTTPPASPAPGQLWWQNELGVMLIYYDDGNSIQWVPAAPAASTGGAPPGSIMDYAGATAPTGWLLCNGASRTVAGDATLFAAIGYTYGGSGANFNLPNLQGMVVAMMDGGRGILTSVPNTLGATGGVATVTLVPSQMPSHTHLGADHLHPGSGGSAICFANFGNNWGYTTGPGTGNFVGWDSQTGAADRSLTTGVAGSDQPHNNTQPTMVMNKIIKR